MMQTLAEVAYPVGVVMFSYIVLGLTGFASSLLSVPLLAWQLPLTLVVPMALAMDTIGSFLMGGLNFRKVQWAEARCLAPGMLLGGLLGLWLAARLAPRGPLLVLGVYVAWIGLRSLRQSRGSGIFIGRWKRPLGWIYGAGVGLTAMMFGSGGPLVVAWLAQRGYPPRAVRASVPAIYVLVTVAVLVMLGVGGRLANRELWWWLAVLVPVAIIGTLAGHVLERYIPGQRLRQIICVLLVASGASQAYRALFLM